jgi:hypothetical protein
MDMILLDWTRMGRTYCVTGAVHVNGQMRILRPLPRAQREAPVRNTGCSVSTGTWMDHKATIQPSGSHLVLMRAFSAR